MSLSKKSFCLCFLIIILTTLPVYIKYAYAAASDDQMALIGKWRMIQSVAFFSDGSEKLTQTDCWVEYSLTEQFSECETPMGKKQAKYRLELTSPGKYKVTRLDVDDKKMSVELGSTADYRIVAGVLYLTVYPSPMPPILKYKGFTPPVRLEVISTRIEPSKDKVSD